MTSFRDLFLKVMIDGICVLRRIDACNFGVFVECILYMCMPYGLVLPGTA